MFLSILCVAVFLDIAHAERYPCLPCKCERMFMGLIVLCENALGDDVRGVLAEVGKTNETVFLLTLEQVQLPNLPSNLFVVPVVHGIKVNECNTSTVDKNAFADVAANLKWLLITGNPLEHVPSQALQELSNLENLILNDNGIQVLQAEAFKGLLSLQILILSGNRIKFIDDSAFVGIEKTLRYLILGRNELTAFPNQPLSSLRSLRVLKLNDNKIGTLVPEDFDAMVGTSLTELNLANNGITKVPARVFRSQKQLSSLNLYGNAIESIHPSAFEGNEDTLEVLKLGYNRLEEIPAASLKDLKRLNSILLSGNDICKVRKDDFQRYGKTLMTVHLQNNSLKYVHPEAFIDLDAVKFLFLHSNQLNAAPFETYSPVLDTIANFDIHDNPLNCDCNLTWLAKWINGNGFGNGIVLMANETSCSTPEQHTKKLLGELPSDELLCGNSTSNLSEPTYFVTHAHGYISSYGLTTVLQLGKTLLITVVLGTGRLF